MDSSSQKVFDGTPIGGVGTLKAKSSMGPGGPTSALDAYEQFESVVAEFEEMERAGLIRITLRHPESQTGHRYIDLIKFQRLH